MDARVPGERRRWTSIAGMIGALAAAPAFAAMVSGGGPPASDCWAELEVAGVDPTAVEHAKKVVCRDGDPCDTGPCGDGVCDVAVRLCWNQHDPGLPACVPPASLESLHLRGQIRSLLVMPEHMTLGDCTDALVIPVPTTRGGTRPGRLTTRINAKAPTGTTPAVDADTVRIVCVPRPFDECPVSTTTVPGATTTTVTTTTAVGPTLTTSTSTTTTTLEHPPKKTTTTRTPTTSTTAAPPTTATTAAPPTTTLVVPTTTEPPTTSTPTTTDTTTTTADGGHGHRDGGDVVIASGL